MGSNRPPKVVLRDRDIVGDMHACPSLCASARKPARNKVTPLQCASKLVIGRVCSDCGWLESLIASSWWSAATKCLAGKSNMCVFATLSSCYIVISTYSRWLTSGNQVGLAQSKQKKRKTILILSLTQTVFSKWHLWEYQRDTKSQALNQFLMNL